MKSVNFIIVKPVSSIKSYILISVLIKSKAFIHSFIESYLSQHPGSYNRVQKTKFIVIIEYVKSDHEN